MLKVEEQIQAKQQRTALCCPDTRAFPSRLPVQPSPPKTWEETVRPRDERARDRPQPAEPWAGRVAEDFDICWRKVPREMQTSPEDEMWAQTGEHEVARRLGGGTGRRKGNS